MTVFQRLIFSCLVMAATPSCTQQPPELTALQHSLQQQYPGVQFDVALVPAVHRLDVTADSAAWRGYKLDEQQRRNIGQAMARFVVAHYAGSTPVETVTIRFIEERSRSLLSKGWASNDVSFPVTALH